MQAVRFLRNLGRPVAHRALFKGYRVFFHNALALRGGKGARRNAFFNPRSDFAKFVGCPRGHFFCTEEMLAPKFEIYFFLEGLRPPDSPLIESHVFIFGLDSNRVLKFCR